MKTPPPPNTALCRDFQTRIGIIARSASDTKKKELVGEFANRGREWRPKGEPVRVSTHDFPSQATGKAIPYGVYDIAANEGFVNVGITAETAQLAAASIKAWWEDLGSERYPGARSLQITADCGGGNGNRIRLWKTELGRLANETGLEIRVCHFPPGTSKWRRVAGEGLTPRRSQIPA